MTLEALKLWAEKDLLMDDGKPELGFRRTVLIQKSRPIPTMKLRLGKN